MKSIAGHLLKKEKVRENCKVGQKAEKQPEPFKEQRGKRNQPRRKNDQHVESFEQNQYPQRGNRGSRRGNQRGGARGGDRGGRGRQNNRRPFEEAVDVNNQPNSNTNIANTTNNTQPLETITPSLNEVKEVPQSNTAIIENVEITQSKEPFISQEITINTSEPIHNPPSIFTTERENDNILTKLLEDKKSDAQENLPPVETKSFYEEVLAHFTRDLNIQQPITHQFKAIVKPATKHTISQQPNVNFNQTQPTSTKPQQPSYQKPENRFNVNQQFQGQQDFSNFQNMNPYQWMYYMMNMNPYMV